jgi:hypothetical protein
MPAPEPPKEPAPVEAPPAAVEAPVSPPAVAPALKPPRRPAHHASRHEEARPAETVAPPVTGFGRLTLDTTPWTEVFLGTNRLGSTPLIDVGVPAGHLKLRARNPDSSAEHVIEVDIKPGETTARRVAW